MEYPSDWKMSDREGKPGVAFESNDGTKKIFINTFQAPEGAILSPLEELADFESNTSQANLSAFGDDKPFVFSRREIKRSYQTSTIAAFCTETSLGLCACKYASPTICVIVQVHDYASRNQTSFDLFWRSILKGFTPVDDET